MSTDTKVTKNLMKTLENGREGFEKAAGLVVGDNPTIAAMFRRMAEQRSGFYNELQTMAKQYGDDIEEDGTIAAALHRGWMSLKDAVAGSDPKGALDAAEQGEEHAVKEYADALEKTDLSTDLRAVVTRQYAAIKIAHHEVKALSGANARNN